MSGAVPGPAVCPVCSGGNIRRILEIGSVPVFCNIQLDTRQEALSQPVGDMRLEYCRDCDHVFNSAFDAALLSYSESYENSLHFSATFSRFAEKLAQRLVERYSLKGKRVIDVGCGKGDFLSLVCELGGNEGFGFDKSYEEGRAKNPSRGTVNYFQEFFSRDYSHIHPDLVTCRHVLEHISEPANFLDEIVSAVGRNADCVLYFEVPNVLFTLRDLGIWDLIYEHCQYFSPRSLEYLFSRERVVVEEVYECFGRQFLALVAYCGPRRDSYEEQDLAKVTGDDVSVLAERFESEFRLTTERWEQELASLEKSAVVWGAGSKGTMFLNLLSGANRIAAIVDINPSKQGKFVPCTGHAIVGPDALTTMRPDLVYVMNRMYREEIVSQLLKLGLDAEVRVVD